MSTWLVATTTAATTATADLPWWLSSWFFWLVVGFAGQAVFTARMLVQWIASERKRDSVVPVAFWWLSLVGGLLLLSYAISKRDPVIIVGQSMGAFIYARNLMLLGRRRQREAAEEARQTAEVLAASAVDAPTAALAAGSTSATLTRATEAAVGSDGASAIPRPHLATAKGGAHESRNGNGAARRVDS